MREQQQTLDERKQETLDAPAVDEVDASVGERSLALLQREVSRGGHAVQKRSAAGPEVKQDPAAVQEVAAQGVSGPGGALPHQDAIQRSFGSHDVSHVQAHVGGPAAGAAGAIGAEAYATGDRVAFAQAPDLHTAAHEAAHVVQQQSGVALLGGVGREGDVHEDHADMVADRVVAGESAQDLLSAKPGADGPTGGVQMKKEKTKASPLVAQLLAAIDQSARAGLAQLLEHDDKAAAVEASGKVRARIEHLLSVTAEPGEKSIAFDAHAADAALALGHAQELSDQLEKEAPGESADLEESLGFVRNELSEAGWKWKASAASTGKAGKGLTRKEDALIVTETLEVVERRMEAVKGSDDVGSLRATCVAIAEDIRHAAREAKLVSTKADEKKKLARAVAKFGLELGKFRAQLAKSKTDAVLPIDAVRHADIELLEAVGLPASQSHWKVDETHNAERSREVLADLRERRASDAFGGVDSEDEREQVSAQNEADVASQAVVGMSKNATGGEVDKIVNQLLLHIETIEGGRADGYSNALGDLTAKAVLDKEADYQTFGWALAGNLLWALSGVLPGAPGVRIATGLVARYFKGATAATKASMAVGTTLGTVGAMMPLLAAGLPKGAAPSDLLIEARRKMNIANSTICNALRRDVHEQLVSAVAAAPPDKTTDAQVYAADIQIGLQHLLYGDVYDNDLNSGSLPDRGKISLHARDALLSQYILSNSAISGNKLEASAAADGHTMIGEATAVLGGPEKLHVDTYELVYNQILNAADEMGCKVSIKMEDIEAMVTQGWDSWEIPVADFDPYAAWGETQKADAMRHTRWRTLYQNDVTRSTPEIRQEPQVVAENVAKISQVEIMKADLYTGELGRQKVYSLKKVYFQAYGRGKVDADPESSDNATFDMPAAFRIRYRIKK